VVRSRLNIVSQTRAKRKDLIRVNERKPVWCDLGQSVALLSEGARGLQSLSRIRVAMHSESASRYNHLPNKGRRLSGSFNSVLGCRQWANVWPQGTRTLSMLSKAIGLKSRAPRTGRLSNLLNKGSPVATVIESLLRGPICASARRVIAIMPSVSHPAHF
jgi:hypothetical protein